MKLNDIVLQQGDCLELMKKIPDGSIDLIVTDPPYKLVSGGCVGKRSMANTGIFKSNSDAVRKGKLFNHNEITFAEWIPEAFRVLKEKAHCYIMINGRNLAALQNECEKAGFIYQNLLVWNKGNVTPSKWYMNQCEFILMLRKGKAKNINVMGTSTLLDAPNIIGEKCHPTEKPVALMQKLVINSSKYDETVLDPFMGSGSAGIACLNTSRKFIGMELDEQYFEIAKERIEEARKRLK